MASQRWNRHLDVQTKYFENENLRRHQESENDYWHSEAGQYHIRYNDERNLEIDRRNEEVIENLKHFYLSRNGIIIVLIASIGLCILSSTLNIIGFIGWNFCIGFLIFGYYFVFAKNKVRQEINNRQTMIRLSAREKSYDRRR
jgi:hypothetical protein